MVCDSLQALYHLISSKMFGDIEKICNTRQMRRRTVFDMMRMVQPRRQLQLTALVSQLLTSRSPKKYQEEERCLYGSSIMLMYHVVC